jgi:hypothetical protein
MKIDLQPYSGSDKYFSPLEELARRCDPVEPAMGSGKCTMPYCQCNWYVAPNAGPPLCANNVGCGHPFSAHT